MCSILCIYRRGFIHSSNDISVFFFELQTHNFFGLNTLYNRASINPNVVKVPPMIAHNEVK